MPFSFRPRTQSIGAKIFGAFVTMGLITGALGGYGLHVLSAAGGIVVDTYDRPLMAINFARSASLDFAMMDKEAMRRQIAGAADRQAIDGTLDQLAVSFFDDLAVAEQRSLADDERAVIAEIRKLAEQWNELRRTGGEAATAALDGTAQKIIADFDRLTELLADHSFVERRKAVWSISYFTYTSVAATVGALLLAAGITWLLTRRIIPAAKVADRIADGELQAPIPVGGGDETGVLLRSMTVMQDSIRVMMERERAQRRSAQSRLADALESSSEGMLLVDADGKIVIANSQIANFFPSVASYVVEGADFAGLVRLVRPQLVQRGDLGDAARVAMERGQADGLASDGEYQLENGRWVRFSRTGTRDGGFILFFSDFTEIKEREERFKDAKRQAEAASTAKTNFLANMSHELRTPLNAVIGFSEIMSGEVFGKLGNQRYLDYTGDILRSGRHLLDIINGVLDLAKSESGKLRLEAERVDIREILADCTTMLREQCAKAQLELRLAPLAEPLLVRGEPAKLRQIFLNLLSNAVKFTGPGGAVTLTAAANAAGTIVVGVGDTGIGMSPADIQVALEPFGQVDSSLARRYEGTGLGLPLTHALVKLHGGTILIDSARGRGTTVTVSLPRLAASGAPAALPAAVGQRERGAMS